MCQALHVSQSGYYAYIKRPESKRSVENRKLLDTIRNIHHESRKIYGSPQITKNLPPDQKASRGRVARLMQANGIQSKVVKKYKATTYAKHNLPVADNLLNQNFETKKPREKWLTDIKYIPTDEGWLYLAGVMDLYGRAIAGWAMDSRMKTELVSSALKQAIGRAGAVKGLIVHSDRGVQYASKKYQRLLKKHDFVCSMSRINDKNANDVQTQAITTLYLKGVAKGAGTNTFKPNNQLRLEELITFLGRIAGESALKNSISKGILDQNTRWPSEFMSWGLDIGLIMEKESGQERLTEKRTNEILKRFNSYLGINTVQASAKNRFITRGEVSIALSKICDLRDEITRRKVTGGEIQGYLSENDRSIAIYKGIPYAAPPIGELRWKAPQPIKPWSDVHETIAWSASAIQPNQTPSGPWTKEFIIEDTGISEDSLYLNVWTKNDRVRNKPVIVYIHGGAFVTGGSSIEIQDGEYMASQDAVYVSINYRLGILGFLTTDELSSESVKGSSGNYGLMDQIKALKWVRDNIKQFGGDPSNVTIMGQSAGSISVNALIASPLAKGLFNRAVGMSFNTVDLEFPTSEMLSQINSAALGDLTLQDLRAMSTDELLKLGTLSFPVYDDYVLKGSYSEAISSGYANKVELMSGMVPGDAMTLPVTNIEDYRANIKATYGDLADRLFELYPANRKNFSQVMQEINNDQMMASQNLLAQKRMDLRDKNTYLYFFTHITPGPESSIYGAFHTSDVPYFLNNFSDSRAALWTKMDYSVGKVVSQYLLNFARTGDPNGKGLPKWTPAAGEYDYMQIDKKSHLQKMNKKKAELWADYFGSK